MAVVVCMLVCLQRVCGLTVSPLAVSQVSVSQVECSPGGGTWRSLTILSSFF